MRARKAVVTASTVLGLLLLGGCGDEVTVRTPDGTIEVDRDGSDFTIEGEDGTTVTGGTSLPEGFPSDAVPIVEGTVVQAVEVAGAQGGYSVNLTVDGAPEEVYADALARLEGAGLKREGAQTAAGFSSVVLSGPEWQVLLGVTPSGEDGTVTVSYVVSPVTP